MKIEVKYYYDRIVASVNHSPICSARRDGKGHIIVMGRPWVPDTLVNKGADVLVAYFPNWSKKNGTIIKYHFFTKRDGFRPFFESIGAVKVEEFPF